MPRALAARITWDERVITRRGPIKLSFETKPGGFTVLVDGWYALKSFARASKRAKNMRQILGFDPRDRSRRSAGRVTPDPSDPGDTSSSTDICG